MRETLSQKGSVMSIKTILVPITHPEEASRVLAVATELAASLDAHVTGMAVRRQVMLPVYSMGAIPDVILTQFEKDEDDRLAGLRTAFDKAIAAAGWQARSDWQVYGGPLAQAVSAAGHYADLIVLGQPDYATATDDIAMLPGDLVMSASAPVLMVPRIGCKSVSGGEALIGWHGGREIARAVRDALPLLALMGKTTLVTIGGDAAEAGEPAATYLARHGLDVSLQREPATDLDPADILLNLGAERDARLIVLGAYGHSRLRQFVLGGTTSQMLKHMTVPVFLSR